MDPKNGCAMYTYNVPKRNNIYGSIARRASNIYVQMDSNILVNVLIKKKKKNVAVSPSRHTRGMSLITKCGGNH